MSNIIDISVLENKKYDEITINIVGNVDSGKSTLCGILSHNKLLDDNDSIDKNELNNILDDGNGKSRERVLAFKHEQETGRTSSISYNYMILKKSKPFPKVFSLVDLAGHSQYLKTTITGVSSTYPDCGFVLIAKNITQITKEHYSILATMQIPILFIFTKIDLIPKKILNENITNIKILSEKYKKKLLNLEDCFDESNEKCRYIKNNYYIKLSNKTGDGYKYLIKYINLIRKKKKKLLNAFSIDSVYNNITGFGTVNLYKPIFGICILSNKVMIFLD